MRSDGDAGIVWQCGLAVMPGVADAFAPIQAWILLCSRRRLEKSVICSLDASTEYSVM